MSVDGAIFFSMGQLGTSFHTGGNAGGGFQTVMSIIFWCVALLAVTYVPGTWYGARKWAQPETRHETRLVPVMELLRLHRVSYV